MSKYSKRVGAFIKRLRRLSSGTRRHYVWVVRAVTSLPLLNQILSTPRGDVSLTSIPGDAKRYGKLSARIAHVTLPERIDLPTGSGPNQPVWATGQLAQPVALYANARDIAYVPRGTYRSVRGHYECVVYDHLNRLVAELSPDALEMPLHRVYGEPSFFKRQLHCGRLVVLTTPGARDNYFHWMLELLPKLHLLELAGEFRPNSDTYLLSWTQRRYQIETMAMFLPFAQIVFTEPGRIWSAEELIVPTHSRTHEAVPSWSVRYVRDRILSTPLAASYRFPGTRLFIDRGTALRRPITNITEVHDVVRDAGYYVIDTSMMGVVEQARAFENATHVVAPHGAGLSNLIFCNPGTAVLELCSPHYNPLYFEVLSKHRNLKYRSMLGVSCETKSSSTRDTIGAGYVVPIAALRHCLTKDNA